MRQYSLLFVIILFSCNTSHNEDQNKKSSTTNKIAKKSSYTHTTVSKTEIIEKFVDSLNIGEKGKAKIVIIKHRVLNDTYVIVKFYIYRSYAKRPGYWHHQNTYLYQCDALMDLEPQISDFNNDKLNDITFISATAARGANEVRRLFIYDDYQKDLISIKNSQDYPNMLYNKELNCIDAFLVHGGTTTVFAKIQGDSLKEFASVDNSNYRTVNEVDKFGKVKLLRKDTISNPDDIYIRYSNYKPLKEYKY